MGKTASAQIAMKLPDLYQYEEAMYIHDFCSSQNAVIFSPTLGKRCLSTAENIP
jgi:hypothetical protein